MKALVIAGTHSGCGKTSAALALMAAFRRRGLRVQPFKVGPDFIDPGHHALAAGCASENLDGWMLGREGVLRVYSMALREDEASPDIAVIEGVMGLFDGARGDGEDGSTAQIAKWLGAPVLLVVDSRSMARSAAALVQGFTRFDADLRFAGVVFNRVGSSNHQEILREAMRSCPEVPLLGCLARDAGLELPSRHLGLVTAQDNPLSQPMRERLADWIEAGLDLDRLYASLPDLDIPLPPCETVAAHEQHARIAVAMDKAFCFYYPDNLRWLERFGAALVPFSPLVDRALPEDCGGLYLGGGYPELYAAELAANQPMRDAVRDFCRSGRSAYAECGGFMYLLREIVTHEGAQPMAGVFDATCRMAERLSALGYREVVLEADCPLGPAGTTIRGHEFHYSHLASLDAAARPVYKLRDRTGWMQVQEGFLRDKTLGSYVHLHFGSNPTAAEAFVAECRRSQGRAP